MKKNISGIIFFAIIFVGYIFAFGYACIRDCHKDDTLIFTQTTYGYSVKAGNDFDEEDVVIPETYNGSPVTEIEKNGFSSAIHMRSIKLPSKLRKIGDNAFDDFCRTERYGIGGGDTYKASTTSLYSIEIPESVTHIGKNAFGLNIVEIINHSDVKITDEQVRHSYWGANNTHTNAYISIHEGKSKIVDVDGFKFITNTVQEGEETKNINYLVGYWGEKQDCKTPDSFNGEEYIIRAFACRNKNIKTLEIGAKCTEIEARAFYHCNDLSYYGSSGCAGCHSFERLHNDETLVSVKIGESVKKIGESAFGSNFNLKEISIPSGIEEIKDGFISYECLKNIDYNEREGVYYLGNEKDPYVVVMGYAYDLGKNVKYAPSMKIIYKTDIISKND